MNINNMNDTNFVVELQVEHSLSADSLASLTAAPIQNSDEIISELIKYLLDQVDDQQCSTATITVNENTGNNEFWIDYESVIPLLDSSTITESLKIELLESICMNILMNPSEINERVNLTDVILPTLLQLVESSMLISSFDLIEPCVRAISYMMEIGDQSNTVNSYLNDNFRIGIFNSLLLSPCLEIPVVCSIIEDTIKILDGICVSSLVECSTHVLLLNLLGLPQLSLLHSVVITGICSLTERCAGRLNLPLDQMFNLANCESASAEIKNCAINSILNCRYNKLSKLTDNDDSYNLAIKIQNLIPILFRKDIIDNQISDIVHSLFAYAYNAATDKSFIYTLSKWLFQSNETNLYEAVKTMKLCEENIQFIRCIVNLAIEFGDSVEFDRDGLLALCIIKLSKWPKLASLKIISKIFKYQSDKQRLFCSDQLVAISNLLNLAFMDQSTCDSTVAGLNIVETLLNSQVKVAREFCLRKEIDESIKRVLETKLPQLCRSRNTMKAYEFSSWQFLRSNYSTNPINNRPLLFGDWSIVEMADYLLVWSQMFAFEFWNDSNGWFLCMAGNELKIVYPSNSIVPLCNQRAADFSYRLQVMSEAVNDTFQSNIKIDCLLDIEHARQFGFWCIEISSNNNTLTIYNTFNQKQQILSLPKTISTDKRSPLLPICLLRSTSKMDLPSCGSIESLNTGYFPSIYSTQSQINEIRTKIIQILSKCATLRSEERHLMGSSIDTKETHRSSMRDKIIELLRKPESEENDADNLSDIMSFLTKDVSNEHFSFPMETLTEKEFYRLLMFAVQYIDKNLVEQTVQLSSNNEIDWTDMIVKLVVMPKYSNFTVCSGCHMDVHLLTSVEHIEKKVLLARDAMWSRVVPSSNLKHVGLLRENRKLELVKRNEGVLWYFTSDAGSQKPVNYLKVPGLINVQSNLTRLKDVRFVHNIANAAESKTNFEMSFYLRFPLSITRYKCSLNPTSKGAFDEWILYGMAGEDVELDRRVVREIEQAEEFDVQDGNSEKQYDALKFVFKRSATLTSTSLTVLTYVLQNDMFEFYGTLYYKDPQDCVTNSFTELPLLLKPGDRVVRGKNWNYEDQDGSGPGTVVQNNSNGYFKVRWDKNKEENIYRMTYIHQDLKVIGSNRKRRRHSNVAASYMDSSIDNNKRRNVKNLIRGKSVDVHWLNECKELSNMKWDSEGKLSLSNRICHTDLTQNSQTTTMNEEDSKPVENNVNEPVVQDNLTENQLDSDVPKSNDFESDCSSQPIQLKFHESISSIFSSEANDSEDIATDKEIHTEQYNVLYRLNEIPQREDIVFLDSLKIPNLRKIYDSNDLEALDEPYLVTDVNWRSTEENNTASDVNIDTSGIVPNQHHTQLHDMGDIMLELELSYKGSMFKQQVLLQDKTKPLAYYVLKLFEKVERNQHYCNFLNDFHSPLYRLNYYEANTETSTSQEDRNTTNSAECSDDISKLKLLSFLTRNLPFSLHDKIRKALPSLNRLIEHQLEQPLFLISLLNVEWLHFALYQCKNAILFDHRLKYFYHTAFGLGRSIAEFEAERSALDSSYSPLYALKSERYAISRQNILQDGLTCIRKTCGRDVVVEFVFDGEEGIGIGPTIEAYHLIASHFQQKAMAMWLIDDFTGIQFPNGLFPAPYRLQLEDDNFKRILEQFRQFGQFLARCIADRRNVDITLNVVLAKIICSQSYEPSLADMKVVDPIRFKVLECLYNKENEISGKSLKNFIDDICLSMEYVPPSSDYGYSNIPLNAKADMVNCENRIAYVQETLNLMLSDGIKHQVDALIMGISDYFDVQKLNCFTAEEFVQLIHGDCRLKWTMDELRANIDARHGLNKDSFEYNALLEILYDFEIEDRKKFVQFISGSNCLPTGGLAKLSPAITVSLKSDGGFPSVNTCMHNLKIPPSDSKAQLQERLLMSMFYCEGFAFN